MARYHKTSVTLVEPTKESVDTFQAFFREHLDGAGRVIFEGDHRFSFYTAFEGHDIEGLAPLLQPWHLRNLEASTHF